MLWRHVIGLVFCSFLGCKQSASPDQEQLLERAAAHTIRNELEQASSILNRSELKNLDQRQFLAACVSLSSGNFDDADRCLAKIKRKDPAINILSKLIEMRRTGAKSTHETLVRAWIKAGQPNVRDSAFLNNHELMGLTYELRVQKEHLVPTPTTPEQFLYWFSVVSDIDVIKEGVGSLRFDEEAKQLAVQFSSENHPLWVRLTAISILINEDHETPIDEAARNVVVGVLADAMKAQPDNLYYRLFWAEQANIFGETLTEENLTLLKSWAVRMRRFDADLSANYFAFLKALLPHMSPIEARARAFQSACFVMHTTLLQQIGKKGTAKLDGTLWIMANQVADGPTFLDLLLGTAELERIAVRMGDENLIELAGERRQEAMRFYGQWGSSTPLGIGWPLPEIWMAIDRFAEGEIAYFKKLDALLPKPR